jgi:hypothetical protein
MTRYKRSPRSGGAQIGGRLGPVAIAFLPMILSTLLFLPALSFEGRKLGRPFH